MLAPLPTRFKARRLFYLAAIALVAAGLLHAESRLPGEAAFLLWATFTGIFLTYRFNDHIDCDPDSRLNLGAFLRVPLNLAVALQFLLVLTPLSWLYLSPFRVGVLAVTGFLGFLYSVKVPLGGGRQLRLKEVFGLKNLLIGLCWGALILVGANEATTAGTLALFLLASAQVTIGSALRDLSDTQQDELDGVRTLPVVLGRERTLMVLAVANLASLAPVLWLMGAGAGLFTALAVVLWRGIGLAQVKWGRSPELWTQPLNLLTCTVLLLAEGMPWS